jgi:hypothetical protein
VRIVYLVLFLISGCYLLSSSSAQKQMIEGKIYTTGNEPFVELAIESKDGKVYLISKNSPVYKSLWENQGRYVLIEVERKETKGMEKGKFVVKSFKVLEK